MIDAHPASYQFFWRNRLYTVNVSLSANCFHITTEPFCEELESFIREHYTRPPLTLYADMHKPYLVGDPRKGR